jgi:beta-phosphoglucomutase-like phosphatase (HAD superfamily)
MRHAMLQSQFLRSWSNIQKPAPGVYRHACERLGPPTADSLAFEDSLTAMRSAIAAGLRLISIPAVDQPDLPGDWPLTTLDHDELHTWTGAWPARDVAPIS